MRIATVMSTIMLLPLLLNGCAVVAKVNARKDLEASRDSYQNCLRQNPKNTSACESARQAFEVDLQIYRALDAGTKR